MKTLTVALRSIRCRKISFAIIFRAAFDMYFYHNMYGLRTALSVQYFIYSRRYG